MNLIALDIYFNNENGFHVQWWETCKITNIAFSKWTSIVTYHECYWLETYFLSWALFLGIFMAFFSVQYRLIIKWMWIIFVTNVAMLLKTDFTLFEFSSTFISFAILANLDISNIYITWLIFIRWTNALFFKLYIIEKTKRCLIDKLSNTSNFSIQLNWLILLYFFNKLFNSYDNRKKFLLEMKCQSHCMKSGMAIPSEQFELLDKLDIRKCHSYY